MVSQLGWIALLFLDLSIAAAFACAIVLVLVELVGPFVAEHVRGGTPWHAHHIAERYGLMVIIALGEGLLGTTAALGALLDVTGLDRSTPRCSDWPASAMTFGMWWTYFVVPCGDLLHAHRVAVFGWGYGHIPLFGAVVAVGAGLHAAAYYLEHHSTLSATGTLLTVAIPLSAYLLGLYLLYAALTRTLDPFHFLLIALTAARVAAAIGLSARGCVPDRQLLVLAPSPG